MLHFYRSDNWVVEFKVSKVRGFLRRPPKWTKSSPSIWHLLHSVKSTVKISSIFVAFLENMNLINTVYQCQLLRLFEDIQISFSIGLNLYSPHFLCWISGVVPFNSWLISSWEENNCSYKLSNWQTDKMTTIFTQKYNFEHFEWNRCHFVHLLSL